MIDNYMIYKNLPTLDLHGCDRYLAEIEINEFIEDSSKSGKKLIIIIHGKGLGIIRKTTHETLDNNENVLAHKIDMYNDGQTIVELK